MPESSVGEQVLPTCPTAGSARSEWSPCGRKQFQKPPAVAAEGCSKQATRRVGCSAMPGPAAQAAASWDPLCSITSSGTGVVPSDPVGTYTSNEPIADTDTDTDCVGSQPARGLGVVTGGC